MLRLSKLFVIVALFFTFSSHSANAADEYCGFSYPADESVFDIPNISLSFHTSPSFNITFPYELHFGENEITYSHADSEHFCIETISVYYIPKIDIEKNLGDCECKAEGNPINAGTGNKYQVETDYIGATNTRLELLRYYNSQDTLSSNVGASWHNTWDRKLSFPDSSTVIVSNEQGKRVTFISTSGSWTSDPDVTSKLFATMTGSVQTGWQLVTTEDASEFYDIQGQLISIKERSGLTTQLTYDNQNRLYSVTGPFGHQMVFNYPDNSSSFISSVGLPDGGVLKYTYDDLGNLISVTYPDNTVRKYVYNEASNTSNTNLPHALTGVIDENNKRYATYQYDAEGRATQSSHAGGENQTTLTYNADGTSSVSDANGNIHQHQLTAYFGVVKPAAITGAPAPNVGAQAYSYDKNGFVSSKTDFNGNVTNFVNDERGLELSRTEAVGATGERTITTQWHQQFHLPTQINEPNRVTTFNYDAAGNLLDKTITADGTSVSWIYTWNTKAQITSLTDPKGNKTQYTYDSAGNLTSVTNPLGHVNKFTTYDDNGRPTTQIDSNGLITTLSWTPRGQLKNQTVGTETTSYSYTPMGLLASIGLPDGSAITYSYNDAHQLIGISDTLGNHIAYELDTMGNILAEKITDINNTLKFSRSHAYDAVNRLAKDIGAVGQSTNYDRDPNGNLIGIKDPLNNQTTHSYDSLDRLVSSIDPLGNATLTTYDIEDNPLSITDPLGHITSYGYDGFGHRLTTNSPDTNQSQSIYDAVGNLISTIDARWEAVNYSYDELNRVTQISFANSPPIVFTYDQGPNGIGRLTQMSDGTGTTQWNYDLHGRVTKKTLVSGSLTLNTLYNYNANGQLTALTYPSGKVVNFRYNGNGQVIGLDSNQTPLLTDIRYQPFGLVKSWTFGNGISTNRSYDLDGRLIAYDLGDRSRQLDYDAANRITGYTDTDLNYDQTFRYDELGRLIGFTDPATEISYSYDANGNRTQQLNAGSNSQDYTLDANSNRLLDISNNNQPIKTYSYDAAGHMLNDGYTTFTYDGRGRLVQASNVSMGIEQYRIDGFGQRYAKVIGNAPDLSGDANQDGTLSSVDLRLIVLMVKGSVPVNLAADCNHDGKITNADAICTQAKLADMRLNPGKYVQVGTYFVYDGAGHLLGEYTQSGTPIQETIWLSDTPVAVLKGANQYYVFADHLDTPRAIADIFGNVVWRWDSEAFGVTAANEDPDGNGAQFVYNLRFPGQYYDKSTGLHYNWNRDYNPSIGRYVESDPIGLAGGSNTYAYVFNNPIGRFDPDGLQSQYPMRSQQYLRPQGWGPGAEGRAELFENISDVLDESMSWQQFYLELNNINKQRKYRPPLTPEQWKNLPDPYLHPHKCTPGNPSGKLPPPLLIQG